MRRGRGAGQVRIQRRLRVGFIIFSVISSLTNCTMSSMAV